MSTDDENEIAEPAKNGFQSFGHAAADIVLAADFNEAGTRVAVCSADHKIRVYSISQHQVWNLLDQFRGHDAEVLDVQWISCSLGQFFATIGGDNKLKIWTEDPSQRVTKGRRFRCIYSQSQPNHVSYVSFGFKTIHHDVWLALLTHDGSLALFEPADPESFSSWNQIDQLFPFGQHHRGTEARFRMSFHQSEGPSANALSAGLEPKAISLAISAMSSIKLYRAVKPEEATEGNYQLYEMLHTEIDNALINEIAWAPGCLHPYDIVSVACNDATVRIFHIDTQAVAVTPPQISSYTVQGPTVRRAPSGIGAGLADMSRTTASRQAKANKMNLTHVSKEVAVLSHEEGSPVWKVKWIYDGSALASTGDNGRVHLWRESLNGTYIEFAETEPT